MRTIETTVCKFDELSDRAKEKARDWYRQGALNYDWWDSVYEDAAQCGKILGIDLNQKPVKLMNGSTRCDPAIYFSGFSSQGDGASFEGTYSHAENAPDAIRQHAPKDTDLHTIADRLKALQNTCAWHLEARITSPGQYHSVNAEMYNSEDSDTSAEMEIQDCMNDFASWIYRNLEREHDWLLSDEQVDESIRANDYEFTEEGNRQ